MRRHRARDAAIAPGERQTAPPAKVQNVRAAIRHVGSDWPRTAKGHGLSQASERCADCGTPLGQDDGPPDGWELEDGRKVCQACCVADLQRFGDEVEALYRDLGEAGA